ncbi:MAG: biotin transporter BioY, partial [Proteobacteria bacterium]|nr:biotin transporter BioY [Pseudomonadota bacterium]
MAQQATLYPTLASAVWPSEKASGMVRNVILAIGGTALLTIAAKIQV